MSSDAKEPFQFSDDSTLVEDIGHNRYEIPDVDYIHRLSEKSAASYAGDVVLNGLSGGEYSNFVDFGDTAGGYDSRYRREFGWDTKETYYDYPEARTGNAQPNSFLEALRRSRATPDAVVLAQLPSISTNYRFAIDRRPAGHEDDYIPPREYTTYFANWQIPIAAPGHMLHSHDSLHSASYARVFSIPEFADMVSTAASNALQLPDDDGCTEFTNAMDKFGDALIFDSFSSYDGSFSNFSNYILRSARQNLQRLVGLYFNSPSEEPPKLGSSESEVFDMLWRKLGFDWKETTYGTRKFLPLSTYVQLERTEPGATTKYSGALKSGGRMTRKPQLNSHYDFSDLRSGAESGQDF